MNGRTSAICCISISSGWAASWASGIASTAIAGAAHGAWAGSISTSRSMTRPGSPMPRCCRPHDAPACAAFLQRTLAWFRRRGVRIRRLLTDNAMAYRATRFARRLSPLAACATASPGPTGPQTNGKAERFIQTLLREWAYRVPYRSSARRTAALRPYLRFYNHRRPHASLGRRSPWMRFQEAA